MLKVKEMPFSEKYAKVMDEIKFEDSVTFPFIQKYLGEQAVIGLKKDLLEVIKPIPADASAKQKYEIAYGNWVSSGGIMFGFIRSKLGEEGLERYVRAAADAWEKTNKGAMYLMNAIRFFSPGTAFSMVVKRGAYENQWLGSSSISEMSKS